MGPLSNESSDRMAHNCGGHLQAPHSCQTPESAVGQFADVVPLELQDFQAGQTLEGQTLNETQTVPAQLSVQCR